MTIPEITAIGGGLCIVLGSLVSVIYTITNRTTFKYCDDTYQRRDLHSQEYKTVLEKLAELKEAIEHLEGKAR